MLLPAVREGKEKAVFRVKTGAVWLTCATLAGTVGECRADWVLAYTKTYTPNHVERYSDQGVSLGEFAPGVDYIELVASLTVGPDQNVYVNCHDMGVMRLYKISREGVWDRSFRRGDYGIAQTNNVAVGWDGLLYAYTFKHTGTAEITGIYSINPITGIDIERVLTLPFPPLPVRVDFAPDGRMFVTDITATRAYVRSSDGLTILPTGEVFPEAAQVRFRPHDDAVYIVSGSSILQFDRGDTVGSVFFTAPSGRSLNDVHFADDGTFHALMWTNTAVELSHYDAAGTFLGTVIAQPSRYPSSASMVYLPVPEPGSVALLGGGMLALCGRRRVCNR